MTNTKTTKQRGYDYKHKTIRKRLIYNHKNGAPCWWCGKPMYKTPKENWDHHPLSADHEDPHGAKNGTHATRLLHHTCNSQRQDGTHDHQRPTKTNTKPHKQTFNWA